MNKPHIYKITNDINGKFYYGVHNGSNTEKYMGSGIALKKAQDKHGLNNFSKQILLWFDTIEEAYEYEAVIVSEKLIKSKNCYNMRVGGCGGSVKGKENPNYGLKRSDEYKAKMSEAQKGRIISEDHRRNISNAKKGCTPWNKGITGFKHTEEARLKMSKALKGRVFDEEHQKNLKIAAAKRKKKTCEYCNREFQPNMYSRYHGEKCKLKGAKNV